jgi:hypothetical protein
VESPTLQAKNISYYGHYSNLMVTNVNNLPEPGSDAATSHVHHLVRQCGLREVS